MKGSFLNDIFVLKNSNKPGENDILEAAQNVESKTKPNDEGVNQDDTHSSDDNEENIILNKEDESKPVENVEEILLGEHMNLETKEEK